MLRGTTKLPGPIKTSFYYNVFLDFRHKQHEHLHKLNLMIQRQLKYNGEFSTTPTLWALPQLSLPLPSSASSLSC